MPVPFIFSHRYPGKYAFNVLAGALEKQERLGQVAVHFPSSRETLRDTVRREHRPGLPLVVAWSFYSPSFPESVEELAWLRSELSGIPFIAVAGGVHATAEPEQTLRAGFDFVAVGEGETIITELAHRLSRGEDPAPTHGFWRLVDGKVKSNGRGEGVDLNDYPAFAAHRHRYGAIEITRGCIYACRFCQTPFMSKAKFRHRSVENIAAWVRVLRDGKKRDVRFISPTSLSYGSPDEQVNLPAVEELLAKVKEATGPDGRIYFGTFPSEVRPEHVTPESMTLLRKYVDNDNLIIGGQSGADRILEKSRRGHDAEAIFSAARIALEHGFQPNVDFILGLPGEEHQDIQATLKMMRRLTDLGARVHGHTFMPLPGTPFRNADAGTVDDETRRELDYLASQGRLYGHWKAQARIASDIAARRTSR